MPVLAGGCHCGLLSIRFETATADPLATRACQCGFCRAHGARTVTDPNGHLELALRDPSRVIRYRFALRTADFLVCGGCGVYVAAVLTVGERRYATLNANTLADEHALATATAPADYSAETAAERVARRTRRWTPTTIVHAPR